MLTLSLPVSGLLYADPCVANISRTYIAEAVENSFVHYDVGVRLVPRVQQPVLIRVDSLPPQVFGRGDEIQGLDSLFFPQTLWTTRVYLDERYNVDNYSQPQVNLPNHRCLIP